MQNSDTLKKYLDIKKANAGKYRSEKKKEIC